MPRVKDENAGLTAWERRRNENAAANNAALKAAGSASVKIFGTVQPNVQKKAPSSRKRASEPIKREAPAPTRRSARVAGVEAENEVAKRKYEEATEATAMEERAKKMRVSGDLSLGDITVEGKAWQRSLEGLAGLAVRGAQPGLRTFTDEDAEDTTDEDLKKARKLMGGLELYDKFEVKDLKLTKERIYAMTFHPTEEKAVLFAGDKEGRMGIFDASQDVPEIDDDEDAEQPLPAISGYKPHARTITSFQFSPADANALYTASYDSSIRKLDIGKEVSVDIYAPGDADTDLAISCLDIASNEPQVILFSTLDGQIGRHDVRTPGVDAELWGLHDAKIGGFSLHPRLPHLLATASLDRTLKLWDLRKISGKGDARRPYLLGEHTSRLSVSHAAWGAAGHIATASYDDTVKVYDFSGAGEWKAGHDVGEAAMAPAHAIRHNNQTGRWVSILKPAWQRCPRDGTAKFVIGNMNRFVDVFAANGEQLAQLGGEGITAVPAVAQMHPSMGWVAGGNASGKLSLWM